MALESNVRNGQAVAVLTADELRLLVALIVEEIRSNDDAAVECGTAALRDMLEIAERA